MLGVSIITAAVVMAQPAAGEGRRLFHDPGLGNHGVACATCHATVRDEAKDGDGLIRAGHTLSGVARRAHWRGDTRRTAYPRLSAAIDVCAQLFQGGGPLEPRDREQIVRFLGQLGSRSKRAQPPLTIQPALEANRRYDRRKYTRGDPARGRALFFRACHSCHPKAGRGLGPSIAGTPAAEVAAKIREGNGLLRGSREPGDWMPFFGRDRLTDANVADIAAYVSTLKADDGG